MCRMTPADVMLMPFKPVPKPSISIPFRVTLIRVPAGGAMTMAFVPETSTLPSVYSQLMVMPFAMVTAPKPPGSRQLISPSVAVFEIAPANVLQGAVRLHGLASSPTPETQVRVACACADPVCRESANIAPSMVHGNATFFILSSLVDLTSELSVVLRGRQAIVRRLSAEMLPIDVPPRTSQQLNLPWSRPAGGWFSARAKRFLGRVAELAAASVGSPPLRLPPLPVP